MDMKDDFMVAIGSQYNTEIVQSGQLSRFFTWIQEKVLEMAPGDKGRRRFEFKRGAADSLGELHIDVLLYKGAAKLSNICEDCSEKQKGNVFSLFII
jgi:hypothetical protein